MFINYIYYIIIVLKKVHKYVFNVNIFITKI